MKDNYFFNVAMAARARGFLVTPLRNKRPFLHASNKHPLATETEIRMAAKEYPTCDVGLVMKRKVGEPFATDIDSPVSSNTFGKMQDPVVWSRFLAANP